MTEGAKWLLALVQAAPEVRDAVTEFWAGRTLDLGPVPPDLLRHAHQVDLDIDRELEAARRKSRP